MQRPNVVPRIRLVSFLLLASVLLTGFHLLGPTLAVAASNAPMHRTPTSIAGVRQRAQHTPASDSLESRFAHLEARLPTLKALLAQCRTRGIPTAYEVVNYTTIKQFIPWGRQDQSAGIATTLEQLYQEATTNLQAYLQGTKQPLAAPQYVTQRPQIAGYSFLGDMHWPDGHIEHHRPIFYTGYGFFGQVKRDIPQFAAYGANIVQIDGGGPRSMIFKRGTIDWPTSEAGSFTFDTTVAHTGGRSMLVSNTTPPAPATATLSYYVEQHTTYHVSVWIKGHNVSHAQLVLGDDPTDRHSIPDGTYGWQQLKFHFTTGNDEFQRSFAVWTAGPTDQLWIDDIRVSASGSRENMIPDPGFEEIPSVPPDQMFYASGTQSKADIVKVLQNAAKHNIAVNLLLSPHYFPAWALTMWPELAHDGQQFLNYNVLDPHAQAINALYLRTLIPLIKDSPALHSICLSNEPAYRAKGDAADQQAWHAYLQRGYGDMAHLNAVYGTHYTTFADVPDNPSELAGKYDWQRFTEQQFAGWHHFLADIIHQIAPNIPVHTKIVPGDDDYPGVDPARFTTFSQISGLDNWPGLFFRYLGNYDAFGSLKAMPIFNSEDHIIDGSAAHVRTALWQGAIHGRNASTIWVWERHAEDNLLQEPEVVAAIGKTALDLNRLAREVTALHAAPASIAIYWSLLVHPTEDQWSHIYAVLNQHGQHVDFITDSQITAGKLRRYKLLVLPAGEPVARTALPALQQFVDAGGNITTVDDTTGDAVLAVDDHAQPLPQDARAHVLAKAARVRLLPGGLFDPTPLLQQLDALGLRRIRLLDAATNQPVKVNDAATQELVGWEWRAVPYRGRMLVDLMAYTGTEQAVSLEVDGQKVARVKDLVSGETMGGPVFHLQGFTPYLFELPPSTTPSMPSVAPH